MKNVGIVVGSLRKQSWSRKLALSLIKLKPSSLNMEIVEIGQLPLYNQDFDDENRSPKEWEEFRENVKKFDGIIFVSPEYNRSIPSPLKNAIDVGSRPYGKSIWSNKPTAIISNSPGAIGGFGANHHLRQCLVFLDMPCMQQPEAYIGDVSHLFDDNSNISKKETEEFLHKFMETYANWLKNTSK